MAKIIKLGDRALFFYCPTSKVKLFRGQAMEIDNRTYLDSKKIRKALQGGHLVQGSVEDLENGVSTIVGEEVENKNWLEDFDINNEAAISKLKLPQLIELLKFIDEENEYDEEYFNGMKKADVIAEINEVLNK